jgi:hypothetical protein
VTFSEAQRNPETIVRSKGESSVKPRTSAGPTEAVLVRGGRVEIKIPVAGGGRAVLQLTQEHAVDLYRALFEVLGG